MRENWPSVAYQSRLESVSTSSSGNAARMLAGTSGMRSSGVAQSFSVICIESAIGSTASTTPTGLIRLRGDLAVGGVDLDAPLAAEENDAFIEYAETGDGFCVSGRIRR